MSGIQDWSTTADSNVNRWAEGMSPGSVNNSARSDKADVAAFYRDSEWIEYGSGDGSGDGTSSYAAVYVTGTSFQITGADVTGAYRAGRRVRATGTSTGTLYGTISASILSGSDTQVTAGWDSGSLANDNDLRIWLGAASATNPSIPAAALAGQSADLNGAVFGRAVMTSERWTIGTATLSGAATDTTTTLTIDCATGNYLDVTLDRGVTTITFTNVPSSGVLYDFLLNIVWDSTGGWALSGYPSGMKIAGGAPTWATAANTLASITGYTADGGTSWRAAAITAYT